MRKLALLACLALCACQERQELAYKADPVNPVLFVVAGQSNALGLGQSFPHQLSPGITWRGLDFPRGIGASFAENYKQKTGASQVLIAQCSVGATSIYDWQPGGTLFNQCVDIIENVKRDVPNMDVAGILFWQGERDASNASSPNVQWAALFKNMAKQFRIYLGNAKIPVIYCQLDTHEQFGQEANYPYWNEIKVQQARANLSYAQMVKTDDITTLADSVHVDTSGLFLIGERMAQTYYGLTHT